MGWDGTGNREKPVNWHRLRQKTYMRAKGRCQKCGRLTLGVGNRGGAIGKAVAGNKERGWCDHIIPWSKGGRDVMENLQWLCTPCHNEKSAEEAAERKNDTGGIKHPGMKQ